MHELFALAENIVLTYVLLHKYALETQLLWLIRKKQTVYNGSKNPHVKTYFFPSLAKQVLIFGGSYWQFRLN